MLLAFLCLASPFLMYIKKQTGHWALTEKKGVTELLGFENISSKKTVETNVVEENTRGISNYKSIMAKPLRRVWNIGYERHSNTLIFMISKFISTYHPLLFLFLIVGVITQRKVPRLGKPGMYLGVFLAFYLFVLYALTLVFSGEGHYYLSRRHLIPLVIPTMFCSAIGIQTLCNWTKRRSVSSAKRYKWFRDTKVIIPIIIICVLLPKTLKFHRAERIGIKEAGYWIKKNAQEKPAVIMGVTPRITFYACGKHVFLNPGIYNDVITRARLLRVNYLEVFKEKITETCPDFFESINSDDIELVYQHTYSGKSKELNLLLYKVLYRNE